MDGPNTCSAYSISNGCFFAHILPCSRAAAAILSLTFDSSALIAHSSDVVKTFSHAAIALSE